MDGDNLAASGKHDVAWLLNQLAERDARIAELEARVRRNEWAYSLPYRLQAAVFVYERGLLNPVRESRLT